MTFEVRGKAFEIELVNNWVRERYQDMLGLISELSAIPDEVDELIKNAEGADDKKEIKERIKGLGKKQRVLTASISDIRKEIVQELLETNGYDYDERFWLRSCDVDDMNEFMLGCLKKDVKGKASKKK